MSKADLVKFFWDEASDVDGQCTTLSHCLLEEICAQIAPRKPSTRNILEHFNVTALTSSELRTELERRCFLYFKMFVQETTKKEAAEKLRHYKLKGFVGK
jgi:hypothetical protein